MLQIKEQTKNYIVKEKYKNIKILLEIANVAITTIYTILSTNLLNQFQITKVLKKKREIK